MPSKLLLAPALLLAVGFANATDLFDPNVGQTHIPMGVLLDGTLDDTNGNAEPWVAQLYAGAGECLSLFVDSTEFDAKLVVVAPNGTVFRDDNSGGELRPWVNIDPTPMQGWYTVQVAHTAGLPQNANFQLVYSRYSKDNVNCGTVTHPL